MKFSLIIATIAAASVVSNASPIPHFTYGPDNAGPQNWGNLSPLWAKCKTGEAQSPIDLGTEKKFVKFVNEPIKYNYSAVAGAVIGFDGHVVQMDWAQPDDPTEASWIEVDGKRHALVQFHFHTPSEHRVDNHYADAELHLVHRAEDGALAVIGLFLEVQVKNNPWFRWISQLDHKIDNLPPGSDPTKTKLPIKRVDLPALAKIAGGFADRWTYAGSLTTPPCTEGVAWNVVKESIGLGLQQFNSLVDLEGFNSRFIQDRPRS
ncbi:hypothetical protein BGZ73_000257 [Actinomortierella ambigua]|nr:hypothetical protein BGZ73_000257 [Actinomortierella ambigua]